MECLSRSHKGAPTVFDFTAKNMPYIRQKMIYEVRPVLLPRASSRCSRRSSTVGDEEALARGVGLGRGIQHCMTIATRRGQSSSSRRLASSLAVSLCM